VGPHGSLHAVFGVTPWLVSHGGCQTGWEPDNDVVMNDAALLELGDPGVANGLGAGAAVVPGAESVEVAADVLRAPVGVGAGVGQGLHPDLLVAFALVVKLLRSNSKAFAQTRYTGLRTVDGDDVVDPVLNSALASASC